MELRNASPVASLVIGLAGIPLDKVDAADVSFVPCRHDATQYQVRSVELQKIVAADQADRPDNALKPGAQTIFSFSSLTSCLDMGGAE